MFNVNDTNKTRAHDMTGHATQWCIGLKSDLPYENPHFIHSEIIFKRFKRKLAFGPEMEGSKPLNQFLLYRLCVDGWIFESGSYLIGIAVCTLLFIGTS